MQLIQQLLQSLPGSRSLQPQVFCEAPHEPSTQPRDLKLTFAYGLANDGPMKYWSTAKVTNLTFSSGSRYKEKAKWKCFDLQQKMDNVTY